ncbi:hypothetical protein NMG60_11009791 [Bertholletia excelsa]
MPEEIYQVIEEKLLPEEAVKTSQLSSKWTHVWKHMTRIEAFLPPNLQLPNNRDIISFFNQFLCRHQGDKILKFVVCVWFTPHLSTHVDAWTDHAIRKRVEHFCLELNAEFYILNPRLFECESLIWLKVRSCLVQLPNSIKLKNLREIYLQQDLNINIAPNPHSQRLIFHEGVMGVMVPTVVSLKAPKAKEVIFSGCMARRDYQGEKMAECTKVSFDIGHMFEFCKKPGRRGRAVNLFTTEELMEVIEGNFIWLLSNFEQIRDLKLCNWSVQMLAIGERRNQEKLSFDCTRQRLETNLRKWELPGIAYMLNSCPELVHLTLCTPSIEEEIELPLDYLSKHDFEAVGYLIAQIEAIKTLKNLREVEFQRKKGEHQCWVADEFKLEEFFKCVEFEEEPLDLLRAVAPNLERRIFVSDKMRVEAS